MRIETAGSLLCAKGCGAVPRDRGQLGRAPRTEGSRASGSAAGQTEEFVEDFDQEGHDRPRKGWDDALNGAGGSPPGFRAED